MITCSQIISCHRCGASCEKRSSTQKYCSECRVEVAREHDREKTAVRKAQARYPLGVEMNCGGCNKVIIRRGPHQKVCDECGEKAKRIWGRERHRSIARAAGKAFHKGELIACVDCSTEFPRRAWLQKRCNGCAESYNATRMAEYRRNYYRAKQDALGIPPKQPRKPEPSKERQCPQCSSVFVRSRANVKYCSKECAKDAERERDKIVQREKRRRPKTPEQVEREREYWTKRNNSKRQREYVRRYERERTRTDPKYNLHRRMKAMVGNALREKKNGRSWQDLVGYTLADLMRHLERQFLPGMTWDNRSEWHIDHIIPVSSFSFTSAEDPEFKACWALTNLRPLWGAENIRKNNKRVLLL